MTLEVWNEFWQRDQSSKADSDEGGKANDLTNQTLEDLSHPWHPLILPSSYFIELHKWQLVHTVYAFIYNIANAGYFTFTFSHFADAFIQSYLQLGNT